MSDRPSTVPARETGSLILREFRQAMQWRRAGGLSLGAPYRGGARTFQAAESGAFTGGWLTSDASINALLMTARPLLVMRSRHWARNTGTGRRFLGLVRDSGVGPGGFTLQMRCGDWRQEKGRWVFKLDPLANDAIERAWAAWCARGQCEVTGKLSFADVCKLQLEQAARDGEYLARHLRGAPTRFRYQLQLLATDRLDHHHNDAGYGRAGGDEVRMGVRRDSAGRAVAYSILRYVPGDHLGTTRERVEVPADEVLHDFIPLEPEQVRGVPWPHAVLLGSNMLQQFENFAVFAAQVGASQQGFIEQGLGPDGMPLVSPIKTGADLGAVEDTLTQEQVKTLAPGAVDWLPPGASFKAFTSQYPSEAFDPFVTSRRRDIASGLEVAYHNLTGDMTKVNYSSARIAELAERDHWRGVAHWFIGSFVRPVFQQWLELALLSNQITLASGQPLSVARIEKYLAGAVFRSRGWDWVDPGKEVAAAKMAREEGFTTRSQVVASKGGDFEDNVLEIAHENELLELHGVKLGAPAASPTPAPMSAPKEDDDEEPKQEN